MRVACVQTDIALADLQTNLHRVERWLEKAAQQKVDLAVFPNACLAATDTTTVNQGTKMQLNWSRIPSRN